MDLNNNGANNNAEINSDAAITPAAEQNQVTVPSNESEDLSNNTEDENAGEDQITEDQEEEINEKEVPFHENPKWKKVYSERKQYKADLEKAQAELAQLKQGVKPSEQENSIDNEAPSIDDEIVSSMFEGLPEPELAEIELDEEGRPSGGYKTIREMYDAFEKNIVKRLMTSEIKKQEATNAQKQQYETDVSNIKTSVFKSDQKVWDSFEKWAAEQYESGYKGDLKYLANNYITNVHSKSSNTVTNQENKNTSSLIAKKGSGSDKSDDLTPDQMRKMSYSQIFLQKSKK